MRHFICSLLFWGCMVHGGLAQEVAPPQLAATNIASDAQDYDEVVRKAVQYLLDQGQDIEDGSFSKQLGPAVTALAATALMKHGLPAEHPRVAKALEYLLQFRRDDGGFYSEHSVLQNYETSIAILCLSEANRDGRYDQMIQQAANFLRRLQWDEGEGHDRSSPFYGGAGYGASKRPDLSNTSYWIEAMVAAGEDVNSTAMRNAMLFNARCQNLVGPENLGTFAQLATDEDRGGFIYSPVNDGESKASTSESGGLRSYGSMTYAGLKSFLYAGVDRDDIRVQAAVDWIRRHYDVTKNPGMDQQGVFYYYQVFAKALAALGDDDFVDAQGLPHPWRADLIQELKRRQQPDGSWINSADRWYESDPNLVTSYVLLALVHCK
ncbi:MAG TPA: terpene cyclase/mutase family protein [Pirellulaceae bacterium]|nr:terpene cyclase/mutase family protein [Pirellulaceae bacterium]